METKRTLVVHVPVRKPPLGRTQQGMTSSVAVRIRRMHLVAQCAAYLPGILDHPMTLGQDLIIFQNFGIWLRPPVQAHDIVTITPVDHSLSARTASSATAVSTTKTP
jgi:hypothetical protein